MQRIATLLAATICLGGSGCDESPTQFVGTRPSPDGRHSLWVVNEYGGLQSGVVYVYVTKEDGPPVDRTQVLRTPECTNAMVGWMDSATAAVVYESMSLTGFESTDLSGELNILLVDRRSPGGTEVRLAEAIALPCDPYEPQRNSSGSTSMMACCCHRRL